MRRAFAILASIPFTLFGIASHAVLILTGAGLLSMGNPLVVVMYPAYIVHLVLTMLSVRFFGVSGAAEIPPGWFFALSVVPRMAPFILADLLTAHVGRKSGQGDLI